MTQVGGDFRGILNGALWLRFLRPGPVGVTEGGRDGANKMASRPFAADAAANMNAASRLLAGSSCSRMTASKSSDAS